MAARAASLGPSASEELTGAELGRAGRLLQRTARGWRCWPPAIPAAALAALLAVEPPSRPVSGAEALQRPSLRELATLALSESFLDLRVAVVG